MLSLLFTTSLLMNLVSVPIEVPKFDMEETINALIWCESRGKEFAINRKEKHGDSWGILQFRLSTLYHFADRYGIERKDSLDISFQREVAKRMLEEKRWQHWYNCGKIIGLNKIWQE